MEKSNKAALLQKSSVHRGCVSVSFITGIISSSKNWTVAGSYLSPAPTKKKKTTASDEALTAATNISRFTDTDVKKQSLRSQTVTFAKVMKGAMRYGRIIYKVNLKSYRRKKKKWRNASWISHRETMFEFRSERHKPGWLTHQSVWYDHNTRGLMETLQSNLETGTRTKEKHQNSFINACLSGVLRPCSSQCNYSDVLISNANYPE